MGEEVRYVSHPLTFCPMLTTAIGDVVFARFFGTPVIILHSQQAAEDLLVKRSGIYSDRPPFVAMREL